MATSQSVEHEVDSGSEQTSSCRRSLDTESTTDSTSTSSSSAAVSFLDSLRCPKSAEIGRKRKVRCNKLPPSGIRGKGKVHSASDPKSVAPLQRVREFPDELLTVSVGRLFCTACREELSLKASVIRYHVHSDKHTRWARRNVQGRKVWKGTQRMP